jgi:hypothetical protein
MVVKIQIFMLGFLVNACIWRLDKGELADIIFPAILAVLCLIIIFIGRDK